MKVPANTVIKPLLHRNSVALMVLAIAPVMLAAALGNLATMPNIDSWYSTLAKPDFTPPNWLFAPIWTTLYCLIAYAFFRILHLRSETRGRTTAIIAFVVQLALNVLWSFAFFSAHNPLLGLFVIVPLEVLIVVSIVLFARLDRIAAVCLWPYAAWVAIATLLNASIWLLNP
jgi:benzodiazapine receptor